MAYFLNCNSDIYEIRILQKDEKVKSFNCGDNDLNDFLLNRADSFRKALFLKKNI